MRQLWFEDAFGDRYFVTQHETVEEAYSLITKDLEKTRPNFECFYIRSWGKSNDEIVFDYGSHSSFYVSTLIKEKKD